MKIATKKGVLQALNRLGTTPDEIATKLRKLGITGRQTDAHTCPVANYLGTFDGIEDVSVYTRVVLNAYSNQPWPNIETPAPVFAFIKAFDRDDYPELIAR